MLENRIESFIIGLLAAVLLALPAGTARAQTEVFLVNDPAITDGRLRFPVLISEGRGYRIRCVSQTEEEDIIRGLGFLLVPSQILEPDDPRIVEARIDENPLLCPQSENFPMQLFVASTDEGSRYFLQIAEDFGSDQFTGRIYEPGCLGLVEALNVNLESATALDPRRLFPNKTHTIACRNGEPLVDPVPQDFTAWCTNQGLTEAERATVTAILEATPAGAGALGNLAACQQATTFLNTVTTLNLNGSGIGDLGPVGVLGNLRNLSVTDGTLTEVGDLSALTELRFLDLSNNQITNVTGLAPLIHLTSLDLSNNAISDVRQLSSLAAITALDLSGNTVSDLSPLEFMATLSSLSLAANGLTGVQLSPLASLASLTVLDLSDNQIEDFSIIAELPNSVAINLAGNPGVGGTVATFLDVCVLFRDEASPLGHTIRQMLVEDETCQSAANRLSSVSALDLSGKAISDLAPVASLRHLTQLNVSGNAITNLAPLSVLVDLTVLDISDNSITNIRPIAPLEALTSMTPTGNPVNIADYLSACLMRNEADFLTPAQLAEVNALFSEGLGTSCKSTDEALRRLQTVDLTNKGLTTLQYMPVLEAVQSVKIEANEIRDVRIFAGLPLLRELRAHNTLIDDASGLETLRNLELLDISDAPIQRLDFLPALQELRTLNIRDTNVRNIRNLARVSSLQNVTLWELDVQYFNVRDYCLVYRFTPGLLGSIRQTMDAIIGRAVADNVDPADCTAMEEWATATPLLNLNRQGIRNLDPIGHFAGLKELLLYDNNISDARPIQGLRNLTRLSMGKNNLEAVPRINSAGLRELFLAENKIVNTHALLQFPSLQKLNLSNNRIAQTGHIASRPQLTELNLMHNRIADVGNAMAVVNKNPYLKGNPICGMVPYIVELLKACSREPSLIGRVIVDGLTFESPTLHIIEDHNINIRDLIITPGGN